jgi:hypothetical protein
MSLFLSIWVFNCMPSYPQEDREGISGAVGALSKMQ